MDPLDFPPDAALGSLDFSDPNRSSFAFFDNAPWPLPLASQNMSQQHAQQHQTQTHHHHHHHHQNHHHHQTDLASHAADSSPPRPDPMATSTLDIRTSMAHNTTMTPLQTAGFAFSQGLDPSAAMLTSTDMSFNLLSGQHAYEQDSATNMDPMSGFTGHFGVPLQTSPIESLLPTTTQDQITTSLASSYLSLVPSPMDPMSEMAFQFNDINTLIANNAFSTPHSLSMQSNEFVPTSSSPADNWLDARSFSSHSDKSWSLIDIPQGSSPLDSFTDVSNNGVSPQNLHVRSDSSSSQESDVPLSAHSVSSSYDDIFPVSPEPDGNSYLQNLPHGLHLPQHDSEYHYHSPLVESPLPPVAGPSMVISHPTAASASTSSSASPISSGADSPKSRRRNSPMSPIGVTPKAIAKKSSTKTASGKDKSEKKVGKRRGPLRPEQRQQAHEIRKLRACLRCKFLKKVCDKGEPCGGCKPSHARLWQVPCTRIDIKDIAYFLKDWNADYERHVTLGFSVANIKGFSQTERMLYITHGYGFVLPIWAREVFVRDDSCFGVDWVETLNDGPRQFEIATAKLSAGMEGISHTVISEYLDCHLDQGFDRFVDEYFEGTPFLTQMLKTIHRYYLRSKLPVIRKGLKLVIAYALTLHITMVTGVSPDDAEIGKVDDPGSRYHGQTCAPVMINFQVKKAMADMWRELMKDILEELSALYSSVYSGEKLKNWPTIFILAILILAVWELMQFDQHYRVPDEGAASKFCKEMESVPVGVIVGLFCAISTKLPSFLEWDSRKHAHVLNNNNAACDTMTEVRSHVEKYEPYLKSRSEAKFDREDFDSLSNKFLSKLVIRSN